MRYITAMPDDCRDHGPQPLDSLMNDWRITNHQLVEASVEQLNHKQVQKARKGRQLTLHMRQKLTRTFNDVVCGRLAEEQRESFTPYPHKQLFGYAKGHDAEWSDPNRDLMPE